MAGKGQRREEVLLTLCWQLTLDKALLPLQPQFPYLQNGDNYIFISLQGSVRIDPGESQVFSVPKPKPGSLPLTWGLAGGASPCTTP